MSACVARHYRAGRAPADTVLLYSCMHQVCSSNHCEGEALHQEFACVACTDSVVLDGSRGGITMLQRGLDGSRRLFPGQAVDALASTSNSEFFAFACDQDVHLTACYHLQLTSSSGPAGFVIELSTKSVHIVTSRHINKQAMKSSRKSPGEGCVCL